MAAPAAPCPLLLSTRWPLFCVTPAPGEFPITEPRSFILLPRCSLEPFSPLLCYRWFVCWLECVCGSLAWFRMSFELWPLIILLYIF